MELFQQVQLETKLEELLFQGRTFISWKQMYCWYDVSKITSTPWRDIQRRWDVLCERNKLEDRVPLTVRGIEGGYSGAQIIRPFLKRFDGTEDALSGLI